MTALCKTIDQKPDEKMTVSSLKRPRVDQLLLRDHSLSTIHPAKKLFIGNDTPSKAAKIKLSKVVFSAETQTQAQAQIDSEVQAETVMPGKQLGCKSLSPFADRTNLQREKLRGFTTNGLLSLCGASNAVTQKLLPTKPASPGPEPEPESCIAIPNPKPNTTSNETLANDLASARQEVLDTIRKVSFLTKEQKIGLMKRVGERRDTGLYGVQLKQFAKIREYLNKEQREYLVKLSKTQRR